MDNLQVRNFSFGLSHTPSCLIQFCADWLRYEAELDTLTLAWSRLEQEQLTTDRQGPNRDSGRTLRALAAEIRCLDKARSQALRGICRSPASTVNEALQKLTVLLHLLDGDGAIEAKLLRDALAALSRFTALGQVAGEDCS